jgi:ferredoxin-like protein FixX
MMVLWYVSKMNVKNSTFRYCVSNSSNHIASIALNSLVTAKETNCIYKPPINAYALGTGKQLNFIQEKEKFQKGLGSEH